MRQCSVCQKSFPSPYKLRRHYVIHTGQKPFNCTICGRAFSQSDHLKSHLQKLHSTLPTDRLLDGIVSHNQQLNCDKPAAGIYTHGSSNYTSISPTVSSSVASQTTPKREIVTVPCSSETGNPPKYTPHVNDGSVTQSHTSNVLDPIPQEQVDSANVDSSVRHACNGYTCKVCFKSFTSSLHLCLHLPTHDKPKQFEKGRTSGKTFSKLTYWKPHLQSQQLSSGRRKITLRNRCPKCLKTFCSPSKLQRHFLIHTGQKPYSCIVCRKAFTQKVHLKSHLSTANKCSLSLHTERIKQRFCNSRQTVGLQPRPSLQNRPTSHCTPVDSLVELELQCKISVKALQDLDKTDIKLDAVLNPKQSLNTRSQDLSTCHKSDEQEQQYLRYKDVKPFQCMICNESFQLELHLIRHQKIHGNQKELGSPNTVHQLDLNVTVKPETWNGNCSEDNESLSHLITSANATSEHQRMNSLHQCHTCLKGFPSVSKLQRHMMTHTGQRPFGCEMCGKRFRQKTHLRVHCRTHLWSRYHKQRSLYITRPPSCIGVFNTRTAAEAPVQEMLLHKKDFETHTGNDVVSVKHLHQTPSMVIIQNDNRKSDKLLPYISKKNEVVQKRTKPAKSMQNHKCFRCLKCFPSASKLQRHEMVHTGLKPFQCVLCGKGFRQAPHLKTHERTRCERKPSTPVNQQGNIRKLKANSQQQLYPQIVVRIPQQNRSGNTDTTISSSKSNITCKKRKLHTCQICFKSFVFPSKLSRHLVTHSGIMPYKCTLCSKAFTQRGHLKVHEHKCRQGNRVLHYIPGEIENTNHLQDKCIENLSDCTDFNVDATTEQPVPYYTSVDHSSTDGDLSYCSKAIHTEWLEVPEVGLQEESNTSERRQRENCNQATDNYHQATDHYNYSYPSELAFEINNPVQNENMAALSQQYEGSAHNVEVSCQPKGVAAISDSNKLLDYELVSSVVENQMQPDNYWCEPLTVFDCDKCSASFMKENNLQNHICSTDVQPKMTESAQKSRCDICFKHFVSVSKLKRHYLVHTGQRPFRCDICGKMFKQSAHVRTHRRTH
ncbi:zinc finger protein 770 [Cottoperca gobio]|uniref:Zinc finger protein 770 n=1 Tax=Cottoperca gobio TaxID=56716 RepID=A0A6J2S226_COTGO|nr:zinc finger protein 770-like [Cottoperca gobio]